ncbi:hypothetical protein TTRE_0000522501 [Trichuris trichiura]|uniref:Uncharacterized protein n=1 Tax=Trichuris trichiura TaxID=36087 RepID=A0A077Z8Y3_TRITR|nr:hypothetical protein TTRE_0000522501 [Trichuris trichiura]
MAGEFYPFPLLAALKEEEDIAEQEVEVYCQHLEMLHVDFTERAGEAEMELQEERLELQSHEELKVKC